jgi:hypothetical protein
MMMRDDERRVAFQRRVAGVLSETRAALSTFRALTRRHAATAPVMGSLSMAICAAEHFTVLAVMHAQRGSSHVCAGYALQAIHHEAGALGGHGPLSSALVRLLDALDRSTVLAS